MNRPRAAPTDSIARRPRTGPAIARPIGLLLASLAALASAGMLRAATPGAMTPPSATPLSARPLSAQPLSAQPLSARPLSAQGAVGRQLFMDTRLSNPPGTACVSCHHPDQGWGGNNGSITGVAVGSTPQSAGSRNSPTIGYAGFVPRFHRVREDGRWVPVGGLFWDGRADSLSEQARGPLFSRHEMNLSDEADLAGRLRTAPYAESLREAFGLPDDSPDARWNAAALAALAAFQRSPEVAPFSSKYDAVRRGQARFTRAEARGLRLFSDPAKGNCIACHVFRPGSKNPADHLFTDFTYDNLGLPRNPAIVANAEPAYFDLGLCGPLRERPRGLSDAVCGMFRVPTLRNVARRPFYFHNGSFSDLTEVMRFYVRRDTEPARWYPLDAKGRAQTYNDLPPRFARQVSRDEAPYDRRGRQKPRLNEAEIGDVVAFLRTLDDGFEP